jgi:hypothetical protein
MRIPLPPASPQPRRVAYQPEAAGLLILALTLAIIVVMHVAGQHVQVVW